MGADFGGGDPTADHDRQTEHVGDEDVDGEDVGEVGDAASVASDTASSDGAPGSGTKDRAARIAIEAVPAFIPMRWAS